MRFGIDISEFQTGVDYARAVTEGNVEFAVLRAGYSTTKDAEFETHYAGFASKIPLGAYQYSYAKDTGGARREAAAMLRWCGGKAFGLPVFLDMEESGVAALGKDACTAIALAWCEEMEKAGYRAGIYANANWWRNYLDASVIGGKYTVWCAAWSDSQPSEKETDLWQFGGEVNYLRSRAVAGVANVVDQNYLLNDSILTGEIPPAAPAEEAPKGGNTVEITLNLLANGSQGEEVRNLQRLLVSRGYSVGSAGADGIFGSGTDSGVRAFQRAMGLAADGMVGKDTWTALLTR